MFEFVNLSIPMQKMCPPEEIGGPQCNKEVLEKLKQMEDEAKKSSNTIWKGLEQFRNLEKE
jgi:uncharacterized metal-binding protein YceD (DUF177 family)